MSGKKKIAILGASGYTGAELVRLLLRHPKVEIAIMTADRKAGLSMGDVFPQFAPYDLPKLVTIDEVEWANAGIDLIFCALPHATTQKVLKDIMAKAPATKVCDLSADFRLSDPASYAKWYGHEHQALELQKEAVYGLVEIYRREIKPARLVANPGCYTTCAQLPLIPLLKAKAIEPDEIVVDAKSGMTGAGRSAKEEMLFSEVSEGFNAYGVAKHRHMAELDQEFSKAAGQEVVVIVHAASRADEQGHLLDDLCAWQARPARPKNSMRSLSKQYEKEPFVYVLPYGKMPHIASCAGSNMTFIGVIADRIQAGRSSSRRSTTSRKVRRVRLCRT